MTNKEGMTADEALMLADVLKAVRGLDLDKALEERLEATPSLERALANVRAGKGLNRRLRKNKPGRPKVHWAKKRKRERAYWHSHEKPRLDRELYEKLQTKEGWWEYLYKRWKRRGTILPRSLLEKDWYKWVWPSLEGKLFIVYRYDTKKPVSLDNMYIKECDSGDVLYDGKEHTLRKLGAIV